jgi:hypothetical protein
MKEVDDGLKMGLCWLMSWGVVGPSPVISEEKEEPSLIML